jgi:hypothetical protein
VSIKVRPTTRKLAKLEKPEKYFKKKDVNLIVCLKKDFQTFAAFEIAFCSKYSWLVTILVWRADPTSTNGTNRELTRPSFQSL